MKREVWIWQVAGFSFTAFVGTLLHFLYEWTGGSVFAAPFSGINESTWEHMKLLYFPLFTFAVFESFFFAFYKNFWLVKLIGTVVGLALIPIIFYTANGAFGETHDWFNIAIFYISAAATFFLETCLLESGALDFENSSIPKILLICIGAAFVVFTFLPPDLPIFKDPRT